MKIVNGFQPLTIFAKSTILDVWQGYEYTSENIALNGSKLMSIFVEILNNTVI